MACSHYTHSDGSLSIMTDPINTTYTLIDDLAGLIDNIQSESIVSRTFYKNDRLKAILFGFDTGQELSEHTSSQAAIIQIIRGEATITLGDNRYEVDTGSWLHMPPRLKHSVYAKTPLIMLLLMFGAD
jgi:quercetin dioxygenase-like cupin family protein